MVNARTVTTGALAPPGGLQGGLRAFWLRWRCRLMRRRCLVAELIAGGRHEALDRLMADLDADA